MAFYSVRMDEHGKEVEWSHPNLKNPVPSLESSEKDQRTPKTCKTFKSSYKTVRYVNSATFIEKDLTDFNNTESENESDEEIEDFNFSVDVNDQYESNTINNDSVSVLNVNEKGNCFSNNKLTYSSRSPIEISMKKPAAFKEWLEQKKSSKAREQKRLQELEKLQAEEKEKRQREAKEKYEQWLLKKVAMSSEKKNLNKDASEINTKKQETMIVDEKAKESDFKAWLQKKIEKKNLEMKKRNEEIREFIEMKKFRTEQSAALYEDWLKTAPMKAKPVPFNKGMFTLKGSMSETFVNPNPWVSVNPNENDQSA